VNLVTRNQSVLLVCALLIKAYLPYIVRRGPPSNVHVVSRSVYHTARDVQHKNMYKCHND